MKHLHLYIPDELYEAIRQNSFEQGISKSKYVVEQLNIKSPITHHTIIGLEAPSSPLTTRPVHIPMSGLAMKSSNLCKHGSMKGLCKKGCK